MNNTDIRALQGSFRLSDLGTATALLTRLPLPYRFDAARPSADAAWAYPLVGLLIGGLSVLAGLAAIWLGLPTPVSAAMVLLCAILVTGAMHEDGLADCADGFWGGWTRERRLEIMKDSQIGTYGVIALVFSLGLRWFLLMALIEAQALAGAVLCSAVLSRGAMVWVMRQLPHARTGGLSQSTGCPPRVAMTTAILIAALSALVAPGAGALPLIVAIAIATLGWAAIARRKIAGQTGDVLGATQQITEIVTLITITAALP